MYGESLTYSGKQTGPFIYDQRIVKMNPKQTDQNTMEAQKQLLHSPLSSPTIAPVPLWFSKRFMVIILMFICYLNVAFIRCNISIAVVEMTSSKELITGNNTIKMQPAEFDWDSKTVGIVLSAFYYGGMFSLMGSYVVCKLGGAISCGLSLLLSGIAIVLHPVCVYHHFYLFLACRLFTGLSESFLVVSVAQVCSKWVPENEKSKLVSFAVSGVNVGVGIVHGFCALLAYQWGWQMIFYITGAISLITSILCFIFVSNQPSEDKYISEQELAYIQQGTVTSSTKRVVHPYKSILSSAPVWALFLSQFALMWVWTIMSTLLPLYVKDITRDNINKVGLISSIPNLVNIFMLPICGTLLDYIKTFDISPTLIHKILLSGAYLIGSILFVSVVLISKFIASLVSFIAIQMLLSIANLISQILIISIAPNSSSFIAGLCTFGNALSSIMARSTTGLMTMNHNLEEWNECFILASGISFLGGVIFALYGSSDAQSWSVFPSNNNKRANRESDQPEKS